jgi:hypothetical protein
MPAGNGAPLASYTNQKRTLDSESLLIDGALTALPEEPVFALELARA